MTVLSGGWIYGLPVLADTAAGVEIRNQATGSFRDPTSPSGTLQQVTSNEVIVTVAEVAGITVTTVRTTGSTLPGEMAYFEFEITNVGNDPAQFFIPGEANITGGSLDGDLTIIAYNLDGNTVQPANVTVPNGGQQTGSDGVSNGLLGANGTFSPGGSVIVRVPVRIDSNASANDLVTVQLGDTTPSPAQNQPYAVGSHDVYTVDNPDGLVTGEANGPPINGVREASHRASLSVTAPFTATVVSAPSACPVGTTEVGSPNLITNGDFASLAGGSFPANVPFGAAGFSAGVPYVGDNVYPPDTTVSIQEGFKSYASGIVQQAPFPGDPALGVPASNNWFYSDGNTTGGPYVSWRQTINGLTPNTTYSFSAYVSSAIVPGRQSGGSFFDTPDDPLLQFRVDGIDIGPSVRVYDETAAQGDTWTRVNVSFTTGAGQTSVELELVDSATGNDGDDLAMATVGFRECQSIAPPVPNLTLVKRLSAINTTPFSDLVDGSSAVPTNDPAYVPVPFDDDDDAAQGWPANFLRGIIQGATVQPRDEIEYAVYFLSNGAAAAQNVLLCDYIPANTSFVVDAYNNGPAQDTGLTGAGLSGADRGIALTLGTTTVSLTNVADGDGGYYFPPGVDPAGTFPGIDCDGDGTPGNTNLNGAVVVRLGDVLTPPDPAAYGLIRFWGQVR
jgi:uncharacterized repeat protein (TIGR01451 family)